MQENVSPFVLNFHALLRLAAESGASDLHVEPLENKIRIRARIDGVLTVLQEITERKYFTRFLMQAKRLCGFDMAKNLEPQDARFRSENINFDLRSSLIPTMYGEKIVLRFLERNKQFSLNHYQMPSIAKSHLKNMLDKWQGLILVTGPTGSGKTTLLYSALSEIDRIENNIHTVEEPIEYTLDGVSQTQIIKDGLRFSDALSQLMRQDPDCILVGEIRDEETAEAVIHAASTGHLVFSTIHANSALESIDRFTSLGVKRELIEANLLFASAQRLVPKNCEHCCVDDLSSKELVKAVFEEDLLPKKSLGCDLCLKTGIKGRVLLFEHIVKQNQKNSANKKLIQFGSLKECALENLKKGFINAQNACAFDV